MFSSFKKRIVAMASFISRLDWKRLTIAMLLFLILAQGLFARLNQRIADARIMQWQSAYERERAEVGRQHKQMVGFGIPIMQIDPDRPLRVIPLEEDNARNKNP